MYDTSEKNVLLKGLSLGGLLALSSLSLAEEGNPRVNQLGYLPEAPKVAAYVADSDQPQTWELRQGGEVVASGTTVPVGFDPASGDNIHHIDISGVSEAGSDYTLHVEGDQSYPFDIAANLYEGPLYDSLRYFYHNRSGIEIETPFTGGGLSSYDPSSQWARPAGHINQPPNQGDFDVPCWPGTCNYSLDVPKGWYDAGDHGKYVVNGGISVWKLLNVYERAQHLSDSAEFFADGRLNIPESGNGIPDILDEARWEMEFILSMQVPEGQDKAGMAHHKMHDIGWTGLPLAPHQDNRERALVPPSITATLNLAATGAQCARIWADIDSGFAEACLTAAEKAWDAAQQHPNEFYDGSMNNGGGGYEDDDASDEFFWAAAELFITTGNSRYLSTLNNFTVERVSWGWPDTEIPGLMSLAIVPANHTNELRESARQQIVAIADEHRSTIESNGYLVPNSLTDYFWGSNNNLANKLALLGLAYDFTGDEGYAFAFSNALDYLFGRNTLSFSFVSGHGEAAMSAPHHRFWAAPVDSNFPPVPPGALAGGPNDGLQDSVAQAQLGGCTSEPASCYIDDIESFSTNEVTINWNGALAWVLAFQHDFADSETQGEPNANPVASFTLTPTQGQAPLTVNLDASQSMDSDGDPLSFNWDFGDGASATGVTASHTFEQAGDFVIRLTVSDGRGGTDGAQQSVSVSAPAQEGDDDDSSGGDDGSSGGDDGSSGGDDGSSGGDDGSSGGDDGSSGGDDGSSGDEGEDLSGGQCNWFGTLYPLCEETQSGWGWENSQSCISVSTCQSQPDPYGIVDGGDSGDGSSGDDGNGSEEGDDNSTPVGDDPQEDGSAGTGLADCEYVITNEWNTGYTGAIRMTNNSSQGIEGWSVSWELTDGSSLTNSWNAELTGNNPYTAADLGWNANIQPGSTVEFGFQVNKGSDVPQIPQVTGDICSD